MLADETAAVLANTHLSADYNVIALRAPRIAAATRPGQFVMVKTGRGLEPLLRRPFSVFEIVRGEDGTPAGLTLLSKRIGVGTAQLYEARAGETIDCLGPLGRPFPAVDPPIEAWMVAGGVGLAPFATLGAALVARGTRVRLFYGARRAAELFCLDVFERIGIELAASTEDGSRGARGFVTVPLARALETTAPDTAVQIYACGPTPMMSAVATLSRQHGRSCLVSLEQVMGCGLGGCYSCVVKMRDETGHAHYVRSCTAGPVFDSSRLVWEALVH